jgi:sugar fermentation stimulation protein A
MVRLGYRAVMLYLVQRTDCDKFRLAHALDPKYFASYKKAINAGVEIFSYACDITPTEIGVSNALSVLQK